MAKDKPPASESLKNVPTSTLVEETKKRGYTFEGHAFVKKRSYKKHPFEIDREALDEFYQVLQSREMLVKHAATEAIEDWIKKYKKS